jgi:polysaccharide pyruvyl transferase CsaB
MEEGWQGDIRVNSSSPEKKFDVLLAGYYGFGNFGDELLASEAVNFLVRAGIKRERIAILSGDPDQSKRDLGVESFARGLLSQSLRQALSESRSLLFAGGGIFQDSSSVGSCFYYWGLVRMALLASCPAAAISQSIGPLSSFLGRKLTKDALFRCNYISVRDNASFRLSGALGLKAERSPDIVMGLDVPRIIPGDSGEVLINVRPFKNREISLKVIKAAQAFFDSGFPLRGIALSKDDETELRKLFQRKGFSSCEIILVKKLDDFIAASGNAFAAIGMRLHFGVLSLLRGLRLLMIPYDPKVSGFAEKWNVLCPEFGDTSSNSVIIKVLTKSLFEDKKQPDRAKTTRALECLFKKALSRVLGDDELAG